MDVFDPVTRQGLPITNLFVFELIVSALLLALVGGWMFLALARFRARPGDSAEPRQIHGNTRLETIWTITPVVLLMVVFVLVVGTMRYVEAPSPNSQRLTIIGHQFWWEYQYPDLQVITANELHVPQGTNLAIDLESADVVHSFWVPHFVYMRDLVPGQTNLLQVEVERAGTYVGACNQLCGAQHAWMRARVTADPQDQFQAWAQQQAQNATSSNAPGEQVYRNNTCVNCHTIRGVSAMANVGPDLTHMGSRTTLGAGVMDNTRDNLIRWIRDPQAIKPGVLMPSFQSLSDSDLSALADYLESLR
ncbi:MAG: cytochrome c oxidase subunit II [Chloroflexi bacterium]|nr:cytochrome c oxidase subunit II [Chloroflexota bacterium]